jgi:hypothetical protein
VVELTTWRTASQGHADHEVARENAARVMVVPRKKWDGEMTSIAVVMDALRMRQRDRI